MTETLRVAFRHWQPVGGQNRRVETAGTENEDRTGLAMGSRRPVSGVRAGLLEAEFCPDGFVSILSNFRGLLGG